ncbi:MAG: hypothetical protein M3367_10610 [Acidobacteriota bacterium]|nr:hypothetical protein [Acidobacteriota bacterium]
MSKTNFISVPFKIDDNFTQIAGVGKFSAAGIVLEYEGKLFGIIKSGVKESRIALDEILDVKFRKGVLKHGAKIEIRLESFTKLSELPNKDGKITLKLARDDFERAAEAVAKLQKNLNEHQESLPPPQTPVSRLFGDEFETDRLEEKE